MASIWPLVAGNWKMNGLRSSRAELEDLIRGVSGGQAPAADVMICPPATLIASFAEFAHGGGVAIGGQDCHAETSGAHTGDIAAEMLADAGATAVIVGHSERRADHKESDGDVQAKAKAAWRAGLTAIICVGETQAQRNAGDAFSVVARQLRGSVPQGATAANSVIAYEPVWAIGTGVTPTPEDIAEMHAMIRTEMDGIAGAEGARMRLLYGGSVKPQNAADLLTVANVNGALVGGASLNAADFLGILATYRW